MKDSVIGHFAESHSYVRALGLAVETILNETQQTKQFTPTL
jgi:hypothetical protein